MSLAMTFSAPADPRRARAVELLARLVSFDTETSKSNLGLIEDVETLLRQEGVVFTRQPNATGDKAALFATIGPMIDGGVILSGHTDVVPVTGQSWTSDPFTLREAGGRLYGRGACDMKGFAALALTMIPEFKAAPLKRPIHILLSYDEETTCLGPVDVIQRFGRDLPRPGACVVGEPTLMQVADAHKSISTYETVAHGFEAHSSKPQLGANAIAALGEMIAFLSRLQSEYEAQAEEGGRFDPPYSTVHCGLAQGGTARNILAKEARMLWEFRGMPGTRPDQALIAFDDYAQRVALPKLARFHADASIKTRTEVEVPGLSPEPGSHAETLALKLARRNATIAVVYATEAGRFQAAGVPTVVCGPGSIDQAHQPDEYLEIGQIDAGLAFMRGLIDEMV
jgi:acetylornithine deacetylase